MKKWIKRISIMTMVLAMTLCTTLTAFAYEGDSAVPDEAIVQDAVEGVDETTVSETDAETEPTEQTEEIPYSYIINEDGSVIITLNEAVTEEIKKTGTVVTTNGGRLNVRTGAGMSNEVIDQLRPGEEVIVIGSEGDWYEVIVPEKTGFVHSDYLEVLETAQQNNNIDSALLAMIMQLMTNGVNTGTDTENDGSFTPSGNMTLIDDYLQIEAEATEDTPQQDKQFITLQSKNGNVFYLVIDRNGDEENVYFLNLVDEADLLALMEDAEDGTTTTAPACSCTDKCAVGAINTDCEICRTEMSECAGKESGVVLEPTEPDVTDTTDKEEPKNNKFGTILILLVLGAIIAGGYFYFKIYKPKREAAANDDEDLEYVDDGETVNEDETEQCKQDNAPDTEDEENYYMDDDEE